MKFRIFLYCCIFNLAAFAMATLLNGFAYLPGRGNGGFLLAGTEALLIAISAIAMMLAAIFTVIAQYDDKSKTTTHEKAQSLCLKAGIFLFFAVPAFALVDLLLGSAGFASLPRYHGLVSEYALRLPQLASQVHYLNSYLEHGRLIFILAPFIIGLGLIPEFGGTKKAIWYFLSGMGLLALSSFFLANATRFLAAGIAIGPSVYYAFENPGKFNAVVVTCFLLGEFLLVSGGLVLAVALKKEPASDLG